MNKQNWKRDYPQMPQSFHKAILEEVTRHTELPSPKRKGVPMKKWFLIGLAAILISGMTVIGTEPVHNFIFQKWLGLEDRADAEKSMIPASLIPVSIETPGEKPHQMDSSQWNSYADLPESLQEVPVFSIQNVLFDGQKLVIYGNSNPDYEVEVLMLSINGKEYGPAENLTVDASDDTGFPIHIITLNLEEPLSSPLEIRMPVKIFGKQGRNHIRYKNQDLSFIVDTPATVLQLPDQCFSMSECTVDVTDLSLSLTTLTGTISISMNEEQKRAFQDSSEKLLGDMVIIRDKDQKIWRNQNVSAVDYGVTKYDSALPAPFTFQVQVPSDNHSYVMLNLVTNHKASPYDYHQEGKVDTYSPFNRFGKPMKLSLLPAFSSQTAKPKG